MDFIFEVPSGVSNVVVRRLGVFFHVRWKVVRTLNNVDVAGRVVSCHGDDGMRDVRPPPSLGCY